MYGKKRYQQIIKASRLLKTMKHLKEPGSQSTFDLEEGKVFTYRKERLQSPIRSRR